MLDFSNHTRTGIPILTSAADEKRYFQQEFYQSLVLFFFTSLECQLVTWFCYHLNAKNALSFNMANNSAAYYGILRHFFR